MLTLEIGDIISHRGRFAAVKDNEITIIKLNDGGEPLLGYTIGGTYTEATLWPTEDIISKINRGIFILKKATFIPTDTITPLTFE